MCRAAGWQELGHGARVRRQRPAGFVYVVVGMTWNRPAANDRASGD
jgi:hypothetical protein